MVNAYIIYPDIFFEALEKKGNDNTTYSKLFLGELLKEKERVCDKETKKFFGFLANYHWKHLVEIILDMLKSDLSDEEINIIQIVLFSIERDGIEEYPYQDNHTPLLDLARNKSDSYDVKIICNNQKTINKLKDLMGKFPHYGNYQILSSKEGYFQIRE